MKRQGQSGVAWTAFVGLMALVALLAPPGAWADTSKSTLDTPNTAISGFFSSPYAEVLVNLINSTTAEVTFTSDTVNGNIYLMGESSAVAVNVNATSWTIGIAFGSNGNALFSPGPFSDTGSGVVDVFGTFNQTVGDSVGFSHAADTIALVLTNTGGTWASAANVLIANADGFDAAAHIFVTGAGSGAELATGFAAEGAAPVPEPSTLLLAGTGLVGLCWRARRWGRKATAV